MSGAGAPDLGPRHQPQLAGEHRRRRRRAALDGRQHDRIAETAAGAVDATNSGELLAARDAAPIDIATGAANEWGAKVVSDGTDFLVVYVHDPTIRAKRVLRSGVLDGTTATQDGTLVAHGSSPIAVAPCRRGFIVTFTAGEPEFAAMARIDSAGNPEWVRTFVTTPEDLEGSAIASSGDRVWLAYARPVPELQNVPRVFVRRVLEPSRRRAVR